MTLYNVIIHIASFLNKDQNRYFYKIFSEKFSCQFAKKWWQNVFCSIAMFKFGETKVEKEKFYGVKKPIKIWDVNVDKIVVSELIKPKTNS